MVPEEIRELGDRYRDRLRGARKYFVVAAVVGGLLLLSTADLGDDPQSEGFEGSWLVLTAIWIAVIFVAVQFVRYALREVKSMIWRDRD